MSIRNATDEKLLTETEMLKRIENALANKRPFSLVRLGDLENLALGRNKFMFNPIPKLVPGNRNLRISRRWLG